MNKKNYFLIVASTLVLVTAGCSKDYVETPPEATFTINREINIKARETVEIKATRTSSTHFSHLWMVGNDTISTTETFKHFFEKAGTYIIMYSGKNRAGTVTQNFIVNVDAIIREGGASPYVTTMFEYMPAPGQLINKASGNMQSANAILGNKNNTVTLGAWGGYIVLGFDHTVPNKEGEDINIYSNAFTNFSEPGIVYVMQDENGNGKPDDTWYELKGSAFGTPEYKTNYEITYTRPDSPDKDVPWKDNMGNSGVVRKNQFHTQAYYPEWIKENSYTLKGSWLKSRVDRTNAMNVKSLAYEWGYADNLPNALNGGKMDIANAVDNKGKDVKLKGIDFIKIQTAVLDDAGWLGEISTEVAGVEDLHFGK